MGFFDFRGAHLTALSAAALSLLIGLQYITDNSSVTPPVFTAAGGASSLLSLRNIFSLASATRYFALPCQWTTLLSIWCLIRYCRVLERRFGSSRFAVLFSFLGGSASVLSAALLVSLVDGGSRVGGGAGAAGRSATTTTTTGGGVGVLAGMQVPSPSSSLASLWNPLLVALATFSALHIPMPRSAVPSWVASSPGMLAPVYRATPVLFTSLAVIWNVMGYGGAIGGGGHHRSHRHMAAAAAAAAAGGRGGGGGGGGATSNTAAMMAVAVISIVSGVVVGAIPHFYRPLLGMMNGVGDTPVFRKTVSTVLMVNGAGEREVYVRQLGGEMERQRQRREQEDQRHDDELRQAIRNSLATNNNNNNNQNNNHHNNHPAAVAARQGVPVARGMPHAAGPPAAGRQQQQYQSPAAQMAREQAMMGRTGGNSGAAPSSSSSSSSPTSTERESIKFLAEICPGKSEASLLHVLRSCNGDANGAAAILLES